MAVVYSDSFSYTAGGLDVKNDNWNYYEDGLLVSETQTVIPSNTGTDQIQVWQGDVWPNNQYAQVAVGGGAVGDDDQAGVGVVLRCVDAGNMYRIVVNGRASDNVTVAKKVTTTYTRLAYRTQAFSDGDTLRAEVVGDTLRVYHNGTQMGADIAGDAALVSGDAGMIYSSVAAGMWMDDFEGGDAGTPGGTDTQTRRYQIRRSRMTSW